MQTMCQSLKGGYCGIHRRNFDLVVFNFLDHDIARQHGPDFVFALQRPVSKRRVAGPQNLILLEVDIELLLQCLFDIYFGLNLFQISSYSAGASPTFFVH